MVKRLNGELTLLTELINYYFYVYKNTYFMHIKVRTFYR